MEGFCIVDLMDRESRTRILEFAPGSHFRTPPHSSMSVPPEDAEYRASVFIDDHSAVIEMIHQRSAP